MAGRNFENENSVQGSVYNALKNGIMNLQLVPGTPMSTQDIAKKLNVSRTPVREAFIMLEKEALVNIIPQKETIVSRIDMERVRQERFIREGLELAVFERFMKICTPEHIIMLKDNIKEQRKYQNEKKYIEFLEQDRSFHQVFFTTMTQNLAWNTIENTNGHYNRMRLLSIWVEDVLERIIEQHESLVAAIEEKDEENAKIILIKHLKKITIEETLLREKYPDLFKNKVNNKGGFEFSSVNYF